MRNASGNKNARTRRNFNYFLAAAHAKHAFEDVPSLIVMAMQMQRSDEAWRIEAAARVSPLGENEIFAFKSFSRKRRRDAHAI